MLSVKLNADVFPIKTCFHSAVNQWVDDPYWFSGHIFKGQGQTTLLSPVCCPLYIFFPWLLASYRFCFYREDKPEFCTVGCIDVFETFLVCKWLSTAICWDDQSHGRPGEAEPSMRLSNPTYSRGQSIKNLINDLFTRGPYMLEDNLRYDYK